jgi:cation diffusion facilitator CzcD-associated flavoprotein CzcO
VTLPARDRIAGSVVRVLPHRLAAALVRWKNIALSMFFYQLARRKPQTMRRLILGGVRRQLPGCSDLDRHFHPRYDPWDQRLCIAADGDFFAALRSGRVEMVTDTIETFVSTGLKLKSGRQLEADIIVTATGLRLQLLGNIKVTVDGERLEPAQHIIYKGMMVDGVPNLVLAFGYTNASWTLRVDLVSRYFCRLLNYMKRRRAIQFRPRRPNSGIELQPLLNLTSGYILRSAENLPKQGSKAPWRVHQNYVLDLMALRFGPVDDGILEFRAAPDVNSNYRATEK